MRRKEMSLEVSLKICINIHKNCNKDKRQCVRRTCRHIATSVLKDTVRICSSTDAIRCGLHWNPLVIVTPRQWQQWHSPGCIIKQAGYFLGSTHNTTIYYKYLENFHLTPWTASSGKKFTRDRCAMMGKAVELPSAQRTQAGVGLCCSWKK